MMSRIEPMYFRERKGPVNNITLRIIQTLLIILAISVVYVAVWSGDRHNSDSTPSEAYIENTTTDNVSANATICTDQVVFDNCTRRLANITLVIPALAFDLVRFADPLYDSLGRLTVLPAELLLVVSNTSSVDLNTTKFIEEKQRFYSLQDDSGMNVRILEYPEPVIQSIAKNVGAAAATKQWVSIFDVDDVLHSQRFEVLEQVSKVRPEVNAILTRLVITDSTQLANNPTPHEYHYTLEEVYNRTYDPTELREKFAEQLKDHDISLDGEPPYSWCCPFIPDQSFANGWITVKKETWLRYQQRVDMPLGEDTEFNTRLIMGGENLTVVDATLGWYRWKAPNERPE